MSRKKQQKERMRRERARQERDRLREAQRERAGARRAPPRPGVSERGVSGRGVPQPSAPPTGESAQDAARFLHERALRWLFWARQERTPPSPEILRELVTSGELETYRDDRREYAQELAYRAMESPDLEEAHRLAIGALQSDTTCCDARRIVAEREASSAIDRVGWLKRAVTEEEARLGEELLAEFDGRLADAVECRPYLRARLDLGMALWWSGRRKRAAHHLRRVVELDPTDHMGVRYPLLMALLFLGEHEEAAVILDQGQPSESELILRWARVLNELLAGREDEAQTQYEELREEFSAEATSLATPAPDDFPRVSFYRDDIVQFASTCLRMLHFAWHAHPGTAEWLQARASEEQAAASEEQAGAESQS